MKSFEKIIFKVSVDGNIAIRISFDCQGYVEQRSFYRFSIDRTVLEKLTVFFRRMVLQAATHCSLERKTYELTFDCI